MAKQELAPPDQRAPQRASADTVATILAVLPPEQLLSIRPPQPAEDARRRKRQAACQARSVTRGKHTRLKVRLDIPEEFLYPLNADFEDDAASQHCDEQSKVLLPLCNRCLARVKLRL